MTPSSIRLASILFCLSFAHAQEPAAVQPVASAPAVKSGEIVQPGMLWGAVIKRDEFQPLTGEQRWGLYWRQTYFMPGALFRTAVPALFEHLDDEPPQWGQGMEGYAKRFGNRLARSAIRDTVRAGTAAALGYDVRYVKCDCKGAFPRVGHALLWNFVTLNRNGKTVLDVPRVAGSFSSEFIGNTWMPAGYNSAGDALRSGGVQLAFGSVFNIIREFAPRKKK